jgi:lipoprotein NlpI
LPEARDILRCSQQSSEYRLLKVRRRRASGFRARHRLSEPLWLHIVRARIEQDDGAELKANASRLNLEAWPGPIVRYYLGLAPEGEVLGGVNAGDDDTQREHGCEASFFLAEAALIQLKNSEATMLYRPAPVREACPDFIFTSEAD